MKDQSNQIEWYKLHSIIMTKQRLYKFFSVVHEKNNNNQTLGERVQVHKIKFVIIIVICFVEVRYF